MKTKLFTVVVEVVGPVGRLRTRTVVAANNREDAALLGRNKVSRMYGGLECETIRVLRGDVS